MHTKQSCDYPANKIVMRADWAKGFGDAVREQKAGKVWWKSNTMKAGMICLVVGGFIVLYGRFVAGGSSLISAGSGVSISGLLSMFLRVALKTEPVHWSNSGQQQWYSGQ
ncbi:unnamed protein product [marine sediment metagenome]|uniref:Uncharacterized protein n=1 Tax=marine sediment metagenome TaxID=412755 RepID=X0UHD8_9ZZZZ